MILPGMTLSRADVADAAVAVLVVVPVHELSRPGPGLFEVGEALGGEFRAVVESRAKLSQASHPKLSH